MTIWQLVGIIATIIIIVGLIIYALKGIRDGVYITIIGVIIVLFAYKIDTEQITKPTALDVYRGKTTLEITYKDSVAIDSTVVYK